MRAHIMSTSPEICEMLRAGLEAAAGRHHVTVDVDVATADRPIPMDADMLIADLDHPCMPYTHFVRRIETHPAAARARLVFLSSQCGTARRIQRHHDQATVVHSLRDVLRLHDLWFSLIEGAGNKERS